MKKWILGLAVLFVVSSVWAVSEFNLRRELQEALDAQYTRAFLDLTGRLAQMEGEMAKAIISTSPQQRRLALTQVWRLAQAAREHLSNMPWTEQPLEATQTLLAQVARFSADRVQEPDDDWNEEEQEAFLAFYRRSQLAVASLSELRLEWERSPFAWFAPQSWWAGAIGPRAPQARHGDVARGLGILEDGLRRLPDPDVEVYPTGRRERLAQIPGEPVGPDEASERAAEFLGARAAGRDRFVFREDSVEIPAYQVEFIGGGAQTSNRVAVGVTEVGGHVFWMLGDRVPQSITLTQDRAVRTAQAFLADRQIQGMELVQAEMTGTTAILTFSRRVGQVLVYPETVKVEVALDNGEILGFEGLNLLLFRDERPPFSDPVSEEEALAKVARVLNPEAAQLVVVLDSRYQERLAWEVQVELESDRFLLFLDASTLGEITIKRIDPSGWTDL